MVVVARHPVERLHVGLLQGAIEADTRSVHVAAEPRCEDLGGPHHLLRIEHLQRDLVHFVRLDEGLKAEPLWPAGEVGARHERALGAAAFGNDSGHDLDNWARLLVFEQYMIHIRMPLNTASFLCLTVILNSLPMLCLGNSISTLNAYRSAVRSPLARSVTMRLPYEGTKQLSHLAAHQASMFLMSCAHSPKSHTEVS